MERRIAVIGLDCASPGLLLKKWIDLLPNIKMLVESGISGSLRSCDPPITIPAWSVMFSGVDPGVLGVYGFRNRVDYSYNSLKIADSNWIRKMRIWDYFTQNGKNSIVLGVPQTYPVNPVRGIMIAGLLADELNTRSVFPANMIETIRKKVPDYRFDIENFRNSAKDTLLKQIYKISRARFKLARYLLDTAAWDSFIFIETALDRLQHAFWQFLDPESINFEANSRYENVILKYYQYIDFEIGTLLKRFDTNTDILIVSDHGAKAFKGGFCINQWLIDNGYLKLKGEINDITGLKPDMIDWKKTKIWAEGGYYARCFFNIKDREEKGIVEKKDTGALKNELKTRLSIIKTRDGRILNNKILFPEDLYHKVTNAAPDALVYAGSLDYRAIGTIGRDDWITEENDSGPDGANHDYEGVFVMHGPGIQSAKAAGCNILDIAPTLLHRMNIQIPSEMHGKIIK